MSFELLVNFSCCRHQTLNINQQNKSLTFSSNKNSSSRTSTLGISVSDLKLDFTTFSSNGRNMLASCSELRKSRCSIQAEEMKDWNVIIFKTLIFVFLNNNNNNNNFTNNYLLLILWFLNKITILVIQSTNRNLTYPWETHILLMITFLVIW